MRATFPPPSAQSSDSREPTPKPSDRPALSLALSSALSSREERLASAESRFDRQLIYGTPGAPHRPLSIARSSSEDSGLRQSLHASGLAAGDPGEKSRGECFCSRGQG